MTTALAWHAVVIPPQEIDRLGLHVCNVAGMRRALAGLSCRPAYVLTDGFPVRGLGVPALAMWKGDAVAACVAAASVVAKVTRDRLMCELHTRFPVYGFDEHKGYSTRGHMRKLGEHGPCSEHRYSFVNVRGVSGGRPGGEILVGGEPVDPADLPGGPDGLLDLADPPGDCGGPGGLLDREAVADGETVSTAERAADAEPVPVGSAGVRMSSAGPPASAGRRQAGTDASPLSYRAGGSGDAEQEN
jgi:hypothetical protein